MPIEPTVPDAQTLPEPSNRSSRVRTSLLIGVALIAGSVLITLLFYPVRIGLVRAGIVGSALTLWVALLAFAYPRRKLFFAGLAVTALLFLFLVAPGRVPHPERLRSRFIASLEQFEDVPYVWGGQTSRGIDCSRLPAMALVNAKLKEGLLTVNPRLVRSALRM